MIAWLVAAGIGVGVFFLSAIATHPVTAAIHGNAYQISHSAPPRPDRRRGLCHRHFRLAPLLSSHRMVQLFGAILVGSMLITAAAYFHWFASVWCFFAAILSVTVFLQFVRRDRSSFGLTKLRITKAGRRGQSVPYDERHRVTRYRPDLPRRSGCLFNQPAKNLMNAPAQGGLGLMIAAKKHSAGEIAPLKRACASQRARNQSWSGREFCNSLAGLTLHV